MANIDPINNEESGASVRGKINQAIVEANKVDSALTASTGVVSVAALQGVITGAALLTALGIEAGATADQTGVEIVAAIDAEIGTSWKSGGAGSTNLTWNAAASTIESSSGDNAIISLVDGSNAGLMSVADKSKLNDIETNATADQTGAEIKAAYEAEADTNAFTDAEKTKLGNIEVNATADQTAQEIATLIDADVTAEGVLANALGVPLTAGDLGAADAVHTHTLAQISNAGTGAGLDVPSSGDAASDELVLGNDSRLTDSRSPTAHTHTVAEISDFSASAVVSVAGHQGIVTITQIQAALDAEIGNSRWRTEAAGVFTKSASATMVAAESNAYVRFDGAANQDYTIPVGIMTPGHVTTVRQSGTGTVTLVADTGMTLNPPKDGTLVTDGQGATLALLCVSSTEVDVIGQGVAA